MIGKSPKPSLNYVHRQGQGVAPLENVQARFASITTRFTGSKYTEIAFADGTLPGPRSGSLQRSLAGFKETVSGRTAG